MTSRKWAGLAPRSRGFIHKEEATPTGRPRGEPGGSAEATGTGKGHPRHRDTPAARDGSAWFALKGYSPLLGGLGLGFLQLWVVQGAGSGAFWDARASLCAGKGWAVLLSWPYPKAGHGGSSASSGGSPAGPGGCGCRSAKVG